MIVMTRFLHLAFLLFLLWLAGFVFFALTSLSTKADQPSRITDAIVVLTGDVQRIETGLSLLAGQQSKNLFVSGVYKDVTEEEVRRMWNGSNALPDCCIVLGRMAQSTEQNGQETAAWLKKNNYKSIRLVTSSYHMHRATMELGHAAPGVLILRQPVPDTDGNYSERLWQLLFVEYNKTLFRSLQLLGNVFALQKT